MKMKSIEKNDKKINLVLGEALLKNKRLNKGFTQHKIKEIWLKKMGKRINDYTTKMYFNKGKLSITISSAPLRQELHFSKDKIVTMLNNELSMNAITEVVIK